jgi:DNA-binding beta-propeller fold protein YncE
VTVGGYTGLNELWVYRDSGVHPRLVRRFALPISGAAGEAVTPDGRLLLVAAGSGVTVVDIRRARSGAPDAVLGNLQAVAPSAQTGSLDPRSAIEVAVSPDSRFAFVSLEYFGTVAVFDLRAARAAGWKRSGSLGMIPIGLVDVGVAVSPDGRSLYVTRAASRFGQPPREGTLDVIDLRQAETRPASAVVKRVGAGCDPVRVSVAADGETVWVTARASNALLGFSGPRLSLVRVVPVGQAPVGLTLLDGGRRIMVLNSNRFGVTGASPSLSLVDVKRGKLLGTIRAGAFPREAAVSSDRRTVLITNWTSQELEAIRLDSLP